MGEDSPKYVSQAEAERAIVSKEMGGGERESADPAADYEFKPAEDRQISELAGPMRFVAIASLVFGAISVITGLLVAKTMPGVIAIVQGVFYILIGSWLASASSALRNVVDTRGSDIANLMFAFRKLRNYFVLHAIFWIVLITLFVLGLVMGISAAK